MNTFSSCTRTGTVDPSDSHPSKFIQVRVDHCTIWDRDVEVLDDGGREQEVFHPGERLSYALPASRSKSKEGVLRGSEFALFRNEASRVEVVRRVPVRGVVVDGVVHGLDNGSLRYEEVANLGVPRRGALHVERHEGGVAQRLRAERLHQGEVFLMRQAHQLPVWRDVRDLLLHLLGEFRMFSHEVYGPAQHG